MSEIERVARPRPPGAKRNDVQRMMDQKRAFDLSSWGKSHRAIAKIINEENEQEGRGYAISHQQVANDIATYQRMQRQGWAEERYVGRTRAANRLQYVIAECLEAWEESKKPKIEEFTERIDKIGLLEADDLVTLTKNKGESRARTIPIIGVEKKSRKETTGRGDVRYLEVMVQAEVRLAKMAAYDMAPDEIDAAAIETAVVERKTTLPYQEINSALREMMDARPSQADRTAEIPPFVDYEPIQQPKYPNGNGKLRYVGEEDEV